MPAERESAGERARERAKWKNGKEERKGERNSIE